MGTYRGEPQSRVQRTSVADQIYSILKTDLRTGKLAQGDVLVEARIAKALGVSRAPIREAVQRLSQEGLIQGTIGKSWTVRRLSAEDIRALYRVRAELECLAVAEACAIDPAATAARLEACVQEMRVAAAAKDVFELAGAELNFHVELCRAASNPYLVDFYNIVAEHVRLSFASINEIYADLEQVAAEHDPIVAMIRAGDVAGAQTALRQHIFSSLDEKLAALKL